MTFDTLAKILSKFWRNRYELLFKQGDLSVLLVLIFLVINVDFI